jgi:hypothetical protein
LILGPFVPNIVDDEGYEVPKPEELWTLFDEKKWSCDWKAKNILIFAIGVDEYYLISHLTSTKEMWDTLEVAREGIHILKNLISMF